MVSFGIALTLGAVLSWFLIPFAYRKSRERALAQACRDQRAIVLTYDDGPGEQLTADLLDLLDAKDARATFFVLGHRVDTRPELARRLLAEGHEVGSHTQNHANAWKTGPIRADRDMRAGVIKVDSLGGDGALFRPPFGKLTVAGLLSGWRRGLRYGWGTVDSQDSWNRRRVEDVIREIEAKGGGVVLMHDFDQSGVPPDGISHREHILDLTARILDFAGANGYRLKTLGDVIAEQGRIKRNVPAS